MRKVYIAYLLIFIIALNGIGLEGQSPKREMRSVWVTTVWGLDWPGSTRIPVTGSQTWHINEQKSHFITLINRLASANINAINFQIRSECDAMYPSSFEPWSAYFLTDRRMAEDFVVDYDPLQFVIEECHKRGIEVHAWINPYRFESAVGKYEGKPGDYRQSNPEWVLEYEGGGAILDPGNPGVRQRIVDIVKEVIGNYDVDGIVFDDYFYAYGGTPTTLDAYSQNLYKPVGMNLHDWRRSNVNQMVADVYGAIQEEKPWVTFGLSPFGIWTTDPVVAAAKGITLPEGITGMNAYASIYCDPVAWLEQGTVDYVSPQLYWPTTSVGQDYKKLAPWWSDLANRFRRHFYSSHSLSGLEAYAGMPSFELKSASEDYRFLQGLSMLEYYSQQPEQALKAAPTEWGQQIYWNRISDKNGAPGSVFFRAAQFSTPGFVTYLTTHEFEHKSLPPAISWKSHLERDVPTNLSIQDAQLSWDSDEENARFVVYAIPNDLSGQPEVFSSNEYILGVAYGQSFDLAAYESLIATHTFAVSVMDLYGNEFAPALMGHTPVANESTTLLFPANDAAVYLPFSFEWEVVENAVQFILEVASDDAFNQVVYSRELAENVFPAANISLLVGEGYYWRVKTRMIGVPDVVSETRFFNLVQPPQPLIVFPENNATEVGLTPLIRWEEFAPGHQYRIQISSSTLFNSMVLDIEGLESLEYQIPGGTFSTFSTYYVRISASQGEFVSIWSVPHKFSTLEVPPSVPVFLSPEDGAEISQTSVEVTWEADELASGFSIELSPVSTFPFNNKKVQTAAALQYGVLFEELENGTYYLRSRARYGSGSYTAWSTPITFTKIATSLHALGQQGYTLYCPTILKDGQSAVVYELPANSAVKLYLTDMSGAQLILLDSGPKQAGKHHLLLPTGHLKSGFFLLTLETAFGLRTVKLIKY